MCIRDRLSLEAIKVKIGDGNQTILLSELVTCLLYTSDAADEEDSVDLGGRRIIKKN